MINQEGMAAGLECQGFVFYNDFDSANLGSVEYVPSDDTTIIPLPPTKSRTNKKKIEKPLYEFNLWIKRDCADTEFENGNRTWFYFAMKSPLPQILIKLNLVDLQRQGKMYSQGMAPIYRIKPGKTQWERIRDKPTYNTDDDIFTISFKYRTPDNLNCVTYFAFTYPFSYVDLQKFLINIDGKYLDIQPHSENDIYYVRETVCHSLQGREITLITISSYHGMTNERETRLKNLFPNKKVQRPFKFVGKKVIYVSARVHPGETPGTFVLNGLLNMLLTRDDPIAIQLRRLYVFKMIPFLNPDGVALGYYRTDTRGVNLNRVYLNPSLTLHPPIYAARALIRYYHYGYEKEDIINKCTNCILLQDGIQSDNAINTKVSTMSLEENQIANNLLNYLKCDVCGKLEEICNYDTTNPQQQQILINHSHNLNLDDNGNESGLFLYLDLHGHASKKGIFMYGNHFNDLDRNVECLLLPKLMSLNNANFHFTACNFSEKNMYTKDKRDGMSREGSGRVAVLKLTGLTRSYTLECNYNTGRLVNVLPPSVRELYTKVPVVIVPPKYNPQVFEEVGRSLGASILDLTNQNPCTRVTNSEYHTLNGLRERLRECCAKNKNDYKIVGEKKKKSRNSNSNTQGKTSHVAGYMKQRSSTGKLVARKPLIKQRPNTVHGERKENLIIRPSSNNTNYTQPSCSHHTTDHHHHRLKSGLRSINKNLVVRGNKTQKHHKLSTQIKPKLIRNKTKSAVLAPRPPPPKKPSINSKKSTHSQSVSVLQLTEYKKGRLKMREIRKNEKVILSPSENNEGLTTILWTPTNVDIAAENTTNMAFAINKINKNNNEPGSSKDSEFLTHNLAKSSNFSKTKTKKQLLRRLTSSGDAGSKVDKSKKPKKLKSK